MFVPCPTCGNQGVHNAVVCARCRGSWPGGQGVAAREQEGRPGHAITDWVIAGIAAALSLWLLASYVPKAAGLREPRTVPQRQGEADGAGRLVRVQARGRPSASQGAVHPRRAYLQKVDGHREGLRLAEVRWQRECDLAARCGRPAPAFTALYASRPHDAGQGGTVRSR